MLAKARDAFTGADRKFAVEPRFAHRLHRNKREPDDSAVSNAHSVKSPD
jgi:hypothetical protein